MADLAEFCELASSSGKLVLVAALDGTFAREVRALHHGLHQCSEEHRRPPCTRRRLGTCAN